MNDSATSLDRLHDIVVPAPVPLWPPAPGWYAVIVFAICCLTLMGYRWWRHWRANAYRRAALEELAAADNPAQIAELLRRVALAIAPRDVVASQAGGSWPEWLAARCPQPMPQIVRDQLAIGVYRDSLSNGDVPALKAYAASWISHHQNGTATHRTEPTG